MGVSPSTVRRWAKSGKGIPEQRWTAANRLEVDPVTGRKLPTLERLESRYLKHTPDELGAMFGVTIRTAKQWLTKGHVPAGQLRALEEPTPRPRTPKLATAVRDPWVKSSKGEDWTGRFTAGVSYTATLDALLDPEGVQAVMAWAASQPERGDIPNRRYQLIAAVNIGFGNPDDSDTTNPTVSYYKGVSVKSDGTGPSMGVENAVITSGVWSDRRKALADFRERLYHAVDYETKVKTVTLRIYHWTKAERGRKVDV